MVTIKMLLNRITTLQIVSLRQQKLNVVLILQTKNESFWKTKFHIPLQNVIEEKQALSIPKKKESKQARNSGMTNSTVDFISRANPIIFYYISLFFPGSLCNFEHFGNSV